MTFAATQQQQQPDKLPPQAPNTSFMDGLKYQGEYDSAFLIFGGLVGLVTGPWLGFQKKPPFSYIWIGGSILSLLWGLWGASLTNGTLYLFGNKLF